MDILIDNIYKKSKIKTINGTQLKGNMYLSLVLDYVKSINDN